MSRNKKIQNTNKPTVAICGLRKIIDYARATSTAAAAAAAAASAALPLVLGVCDLCCTAVMRRLSIDATGGRCAVCAWGVLCDVRVSPQAQSTSFFAGRSRLQQKKNSTQSTRVSMCCSSSRQSTRRCHRCCICTLRTLRRMPLPAFAAASMAVNRRHRGAMGSVCVGRAMQQYACVCRPRAHNTKTTFFARRKRKRHT